MTSDAPTGQQRELAAPPTFCPDCGHRLEVATWCPSCGPPTVPAQRAALPPEGQAVPARPVPDGSPPAIEPPDPDAVGGSHLRTIVALGAVLLLLMAAGAAALIVSSPNPDGPPRDPTAVQTRSALKPVVAANARLAATVGALAPSSSIAGVRASIAATASAARSARTALAGLTATTAAERTLAANARSAVSSELRWLSAAGAALTHPSPQRVAAMSRLAVDATGRLTALDTTVPGAGAHFPSSAALSSFATSRSAAARTRVSAAEFLSAVARLLGRSSAVYTRSSQLFGQLDSAANGGLTDLTLPRADRAISAIVAHRTALLASARSTTASTAGQRTVQQALVAAMAASLTSAQAVDDCLNAPGGKGGIAFVGFGCLTATKSDAIAATTTEAHFWQVYNALRRALGKPATYSPF